MTARIVSVASCAYCRKPMKRSADIVAPDGSQWGEGKAGAHRLCANRAHPERMALHKCCECGMLTTGVGGSRDAGHPLCDACYNETEFDVFDWLENQPKIDATVTTKPERKCTVCDDTGKMYYWDGEVLQEDVCDCQLGLDDEGGTE